MPNTDPAHGEDIPLTSILIKCVSTGIRQPSCSHFAEFREKAKLIFVGLKNGFIRVYPYGDANVFRSLDEYWTKGSHDSEYGAVTHLAVSFDDRLALSGGADGNIFGYAVKADASSVKKPSETPKMPAVTVRRPMPFPSIANVVRV